MIKKIIGSLLAICIMVSVGSTVFASASDTKSTTQMIEGVLCNIVEYTNSDGHKEVVVTTDTDTTTVINDGTLLHIEVVENNGETTSRTTPIAVDTEISQSSRRYGSHDSPFWNYFYYWDDASLHNPNIGMIWTLNSGDTYGGYRGYDKNNLNARSYIERFMSDVHDIAAQQWAAIGASGTTVAGLIASSITSFTGVGAIAGIVVALGGAIGTIGFWAAAHSSSLNANYNFNMVRSII